MQTNFTKAQLDEPKIARSNAVLRNCVHCGFCTATCPTYQILGDELDSPRGRIYLIKDMLENQRKPDAKVVKHVDRCLSCLACMTTCPSGVNYMHLVDHAREYIEDNYKRPIFDRIMRATLAQILPYDKRLRFAMKSARLVKPLAPLMPSKIRNMVDFAPKKIPLPSLNDKPQVFPAEGKCIKRVALMTGCAQKALNTDINDATIRLLRRHGCEVVVAQGAGCCGALTHHMGKSKQSHRSAAKNINAWMSELNGDGLDAIVINTSGCGTTVKDYGNMFLGDPLENDAKTVGSLAKDITEIMIDLGLKVSSTSAVRVAYHAACSLQHGQQIKTHPKTLLKNAGFTVLEPKDSHLCCGSAGTYNLMQPEISKKLKIRKVETLEILKPDVISAGNIGCMMQIGSAIGVPVVHTVELLDWATGGPKPSKMA
ncbi:glycolate oxidase subunit GlcF [Amylibacter sp.]|nr:glycolate oxidase subunit GlcF [Amylibacter sp.]